MKSRFSTYDIICMVTELQSLLGMRVNQVYDINSQSYVIRLQRSEEKKVLLLDSGHRFHTTLFEWPKGMAPSGFTMKLRKHLKNKRLEKLQQIGVDRIVDFQFGSGEMAYHVILELYDRGNIVLTDHEWTILNVLRPHVEGDKVRFAVKEKYPLDRAKTSYAAPSVDKLKEIFAKSQPGDNLKRLLNPHLECGASVLDHVLLENGLSGTTKVVKEGDKGFNPELHMDKLVEALKKAEKLMDEAHDKVSKGFILQKKESRPNPVPDGPDHLLANIEFHPMLFAQNKDTTYAEFDTFDRAIDEFFSGLEGQKLDMKLVQVEREAMKKLQNVRKDHDKRVQSLTAAQAHGRRAADLVARNQRLVEQARLAVQTALANQMSWDDIKLLVKTAQDNKDPIASCIKQLKLDKNHITLWLTDPYQQDNDDDEDNERNDDEDNERNDDEERLEPMLVDIDLGLTAFANARRYYDQKRSAAKKQQKTLESSGKALKSAERKTKQTLKEANTITNIVKARKTYWFEKFYWFISSDNYLVIGGRDQQQNELIVKRYLVGNDIYVHADVTGGASVVVKCAGAAPPPRTLAEAGQAAVAYSVAWEAKVLTRAWWVYAHQVSKSAPTGEYLPTGSFMIRGRKNYLLPDQLQMGFTFMFRLEEGSMERHKDERKAMAIDDIRSEVVSVQDSVEEQEILVSDNEDTSSKEDPKETKLDPVSEEPLPTEQEEIEKDVEDVGDVENEEEEGGQQGTKEDQDSASDSESSDDGFPNTHVKVDHGTGKVILQSRTMSESSPQDEEKMPTFPSLPNKGKKPNKQQPKEEKKKEGLKRGQKSKLKKIKEKYKDQDEEDRALRMLLLQAPNTGKDSKKAQKKAAAKAGKVKPAQKGPKIPQPAPVLIEVDSEGEVEEPEQEAPEPGPPVDTELLNQLTGVPVTEDELLFAVPVVAPYSAVLNYKYKVKLTPGTGKRGKAAKTAVQVFLKDPGATAREKDLLKAVREENIARNFPGKVKMSAPQLHKHKK
ncbi:nuclear export mediator factor NEMF homolog [Manduca sexta]|uniref:Nuclear export mediator factor NEMF homolog n=1 Tax=Manduca sexta TaxID=7130 RepID=A0A922CDA5_MANSE|nr:nuclear export mediator factor NEMF homolog [Manduca sexta]KAG6441996.1 hypothetical protein O3G_MSEX002130 [Manduca sexta]